MEKQKQRQSQKEKNPLGNNPIIKRHYNVYCMFDKLNIYQDAKMSFSSQEFEETNSRKNQ